MKPTIFVLPATFNPGEFLTGRLMLRADDARWLVSTILRKTATKDVDLWGCVRLHSDILRRIMDKHSAGDIIRALEEGGAVETYGYSAGVKATGYRLAKRYLGDRCVRVPCVDPRLIRRLDLERQRQDAEDRRLTWKPVHFALDAEQHRLTIDAAADAILDTLPEHTRLCQDVLVSRLRHREFPFTVSSTGRVFNGITGLSRTLRPALRIGGERLGSVDIRCAQPALLALEMALHSPPNVPKPWATYKHTAPVSLGLAPPPLPAAPGAAGPGSTFGSLVLSGRLYERLMDLTGLDRDSVKLAFLRDVLAKKGRYPSAVERAVRQEWPDVFAFIRLTNRHDHAELIRRLQRLESWLVVETVAPRLIGRVPTITLHDAIFSTYRSLGTIEAAFDEVFEAIGCRLALKREAAA